MDSRVTLISTKFYLFEMTTGKKKLAYGIDPDDAYEILSLRLNQEELDCVIKDRWTKILQRDLQKVVDQLG